MRRYVCMVLALGFLLGVIGIARAEDAGLGSFGFTVEEFMELYNEQKKIPFELEASNFYTSENESNKNMVFARLNAQKNITLYLNWNENETEISVVGLMMTSKEQPPIEEFFVLTDIVMSVTCSDLTSSERNDFILKTIIEGFKQGYVMKAGYSYTTGYFGDYIMTYYLQPDNYRQFTIRKLC